MSLAAEIASLLYHHDCVIVPEFGGFLGQYKPALLQREVKRILPPGKVITFNRELVRNDGLLADRLAGSRDLLFNESLEIIQKHVKEWEKELQENGRLELSGLGIFLKNEEGKLLFQPDMKADFAVASFGLRPAAAVPVKKEVPVIEEPTVKDTPVIQLEPQGVEETGSAVSEESTRTGTGRYWVAAGITALLLSAGTFTFLNEGNTSTQFSDMWPFGHQKTELFQKRDAIVEPTARAEDYAPLSKEDLGVEHTGLDITADGVNTHIVRSDVEPAAPESTYVETPVVRPYHVIIGCFSMKENAEKLIEKYRSQGFNARILDQHRKLFRVTLDSYALKDEAVDELRQARELGSKDAWLLVK